MTTSARPLPAALYAGIVVILPPKVQRLSASRASQRVVVGIEDALERMGLARLLLLLRHFRHCWIPISKAVRPGKLK